MTTYIVAKLLLPSSFTNLSNFKKGPQGFSWLRRRVVLVLSKLQACHYINTILTKDLPCRNKGFFIVLHAVSNVVLHERVFSYLISNQSPIGWHRKLLRNSSISLLAFYFSYKLQNCSILFVQYIHLPHSTCPPEMRPWKQVSSGNVLQ